MLQKITSRVYDNGKKCLVAVSVHNTNLYEAEYSVMEGSWGVIFGQNGLNQNSFYELLRCHQNVEAMATVLHAGLENLSDIDTI